MTLDHPLSLIVLLSFATLLPILIASGTCFLKISVVLVIVRNALGVQQAPSNMVLHSIALALSLFVMMPIAEQTYGYLQSHRLDPRDRASVDEFFTEGLASYRLFLKRQASPDMVTFFENAQRARLRVDADDATWLGDATIPASTESSGAHRILDDDSGASDESRDIEPSLSSLLPAYALSEIKDAFRIGFLIYLPFVVIDMVVSSVLLALGMMMMSPVAIAIPIKLALFVAVDGWSLLGKGLIAPYLDMAQP